LIVQTKLNLFAQHFWSDKFIDLF